ncbi:MAG: hypothetical protein ABIG61_03620 [Planctomycetota bacterium]
MCHAKITIPLATIVLFLAAACHGGFGSARAETTDPETKLIIWGGIPASVGGQPAPSELVRNLLKVTALPADGIVFNLTNNGGYFPDEAFGRSPKLFTYPQMKQEVELFRSLKLGRIRSNFVRINIGMLPDFPGNDKAWSIVLKNASLAAMGAKKCGAEGIVLDSEMYGCYSAGIAPFRYSGDAEMMFDDYRKAARSRGREFMTAINSQMPDAKILLTFATSSVCWPGSNLKNPEHYSIMALMSAFLDGMMDAATAGNEFIDGFEYSYYFKSREQFAHARDVIKNKAAELSADPQRYRKLIKVGFGIFPRTEKQGEYSLSRNIADNSLTPQQLYDVLRWAAEYSDGYVWLYGLPWMDMPAAYLGTIESFQAQKKNLKNSLFFYAKQMNITNTTDPNSSRVGGKNWQLDGDYVAVSSDSAAGDMVNGVGSAGLRPAGSKQIADGFYEVLIDIMHSNIKKNNAGSPPQDRGGTLSYRLLLADGSAGRISFMAGSGEGFVTYHPTDDDNCNPGGVGPVALTDFVAYGPSSPAGATGYVMLRGVEQRDLVFEIRDDVVQNYGTVGIKSIKLIPVRFLNAGKD